MKLKKSVIWFSLAISLAVNLISCATPGGTPTVSSNTTDKVGTAKETKNSPVKESAPQPYINPGSGGSTGSTSGEVTTTTTTTTSGSGSAVIVPGAAARSTASSSTSSDYYAGGTTTTGTYPEIISDSSSGSGKAAAPLSNGGTTSGSDGITTGSGGGTTTDAQMIKPQPDYKKLSAGDIDDNTNFTDYLTYLNKYGSSLRDKSDVLKVDISNRIIINVQDSDKKGIPDSLVQIESNGKTVFNGKTYSNGKVLFFPQNQKNLLTDCQQQQQECSAGVTYKVTVQKGGLKTSSEFNSTNIRDWNIQLTDKRENIKNPNLDIVFLIDATGSMGDEISSVQKTIKDISSRINNLDSKPNVRYSLVSYKDRTDAYRVKRYDFTSNLNTYQEELNTISARGGGDYRESLNEGLYHAVGKVSWTEQEDAVKLVFLIADAPPHLDYSDDTQYTETVVQAVKKGIKIYPVAASGLDNSGEYIFRQLAQQTFGKFLFITYGGDEQTPGTTPHHVGEFQENNLDSLVVNIVKEELDNLNRH